MEVLAMFHRNNPDFWRGRAEEARTMAEGMKDLHARLIMLNVAESYEWMAKRVERMRRPPPRGKMH
jgi:hypothetical protein